MVTMPILIDVAVTPRNDAVSGARASDDDEVAAGAAAEVVGAAAFFPLLPQAASRAATMTTTGTTGDSRQRLIDPPRTSGTDAEEAAVERSDGESSVPG